MIVDGVCKLDAVGVGFCNITDRKERKALYLKKCALRSGA